MTINQRIEKLIEELKMNPRSFSEAIGVKEGTTRNYTGRGSMPPADYIEKIFKSIENINPIWLLSGEGEPFNRIQKERVDAEPVEDFSTKSDKRHELQDIPLYDITAAAGLDALYNGTNNILGWIHIPNMPKCEGAIHVRGDSMYPLLKQGDMVAYQRLVDISDEIDFGEIYVIDMSTSYRERVHVKYVQKSELGDDYIKLVSYNEKNHAPKDVHLSKVRAMAAVKASIRLI